MTKIKQKAKKRIIIATISIISIFIWIYWSNTSIKVTNIDIVSSKIPESFNDFTIVQVSDLHNAEFGEDNSNLIKLISNQKPDIIVITGDLIDSNHTDIDIAISFIEQSVSIAPVYFVSGNHEAWTNKYIQLKEELISLGVTILDNTFVIISEGNGKLQLSGIVDPAFLNSNGYNSNNQIIQNLDKVTSDGLYNILLSHRPELFQLYVDNDFDLVLSGHAHGGQFRIPFIGGAIAPDQGLFPKYTAGVTKLNNTTMIVSRGIGNSVIPVRINNRPELIVIKLFNK